MRERRNRKREDAARAPSPPATIDAGIGKMGIRVFDLGKLKCEIKRKIKYEEFS
jgi:hypothetical protein